jgi:hypothetical protein
MGEGDSLFNILAATLHIWRQSSQVPEDAPCHGDQIVDRKTDKRELNKHISEEAKTFLN